MGVCTPSGVVNLATLCNGIAAWNSQTAYVANNEVVYNGQKFKAKWWTQGEIPTTSTGGAWELQSTCVYSLVTITASFIPFAITVGTASAVQTFSLSATGLSSALIITSPSQFEISLDGINYTTTLSLPPTTGAVGNTTISVRYNPFSVGNHAGNITINALGLETKTVAITGTSQAAWIAKNPTSLYSNLVFTTVGIGTSNVPTGYMLGVNGKIISKGLKIDASSWADFVFDKNYILPSIESVEVYIANHHHLPSVPSEKEVLEKGVDVADMNKILLQKIEELTLYTIQLNNRVKELEGKSNTK